MIHARKDYNRIQDPLSESFPPLSEANADAFEKYLKFLGMKEPFGSPIGDDEPVFLIRAQDEFFLRMIRHYIAILRYAGGATARYSDLVRQLEFHHTLAQTWRAENLTKAPDLPRLTNQGELAI